MSVPNIQNVNDIYIVIGDGLYQVLVIGIICLTMVPAAIQQYIMVFLSISLHGFMNHNLILQMVHWIDFAG